MRRREFIALLGTAAVAWPLVARAQQSSQMRRIGVLIASPENDAESKRALRALLQGLQELGWKPGTNLQIDIRYGDGLPERIAAASKELVAAPRVPPLAVFLFLSLGLPGVSILAWLVIKADTARGERLVDRLDEQSQADWIDDFLANWRQSLTRPNSVS
jgi:hypothetical protein